MYNEAITIQGCLNNNRASQYELYNAYAKPMYNVCMRMMRNAEEAADMVQEGFVNTFKNLQRYDQSGPFGAWVRRLFVNTCIDEMRRKKRMPVYYVEDVPEQIEEVSIGTSHSIDSLLAVIEELPDGYRMIFTMYAIEGFDHEEIGQILGISEQTSKSQYHRAKIKIRAKIEELGLKNKILGHEE